MRKDASGKKEKCEKMPPDTVVWQKRPMIWQKRPMIWQKRPTDMAKERPTGIARETYSYDKRDLPTWQKRPTDMAKETS